MPADRYDRASRILHWLQATLILGLVALGWWMVGLGYYDRWYNDALYWHRVLGLLAATVAACQLLWRHYRPPPPTLPPGWEQRTARIVHRMFLTLALLVPASGYLISTSAGAPIPLPGGVAIPALLTISETTRNAAINTHYWLAYATVALAALHAAAALKHHFIDGNDVLRRMV